MEAKRKEDSAVLVSPLPACPGAWLPGRRRNQQVDHGAHLEIALGARRGAVAAAQACQAYPGLSASPGKACYFSFSYQDPRLSRIACRHQPPPPRGSIHQIPDRPWTGIWGNQHYRVPCIAPPMEQVATARVLTALVQECRRKRSAAACDL